MKNTKNNQLRESKGITLIALVITIIVLLILAGVSIAMLTGENGLLTKANEAKDKTKEATVKEIVEAEVIGSFGADGKLNYDLLIDNLNNINGIEGVPDQITNIDFPLKLKLNDFELIVKQSGEVSVLGEKIKAYTSDGVPIPKNFYYVGGTLETGIIISDNKDDENKGTSHNIALQLKGNQFVWIPVNNIDYFKRYKGYTDGKLQTLQESSSEPYVDGYQNEELEYNEMYQSVKLYKGFYIGRYEASKGENGIVESKANKDVWNSIKWGESMQDIGTSGAVYQSKNMYKNDYVTSTLVYGVQWDAIMTFIDENYKNGTCTSNSCIVNSNEIGNYSGHLIKTGSNEKFCTKNIYDLAGNAFEWTMETYVVWGKILRGGGFNSTDGYNKPMSYRGTSSYNNSPEHFGFRVSLYINY